MVLAVFMISTPAAESPHIRMEKGTGQLTVNGQPFLILGGELGNSSAGTAEQADVIVPRLRSMHVNTILMPVTWEQIEPKEGSFDFDVLDHWVESAREHKMHLVLLWFGSWKNAFSNYAPSWVKSDAKRFTRAESADGRPLEILSTLSLETRRCDSRAFATLMQHVREKDSAHQTVLMVQVENEVGYLGQGRDRSPVSSRLFGEQVPERLELPPELGTHFNEHGRTWSEVFGDAANEVFMAWNYASFIEVVAHAGKGEYPLPMYVNAQLPAPGERPGEYPSGGPHPYYLEVWRAAAPSIDFYSPDIYWPNFEYWVERCFWFQWDGSGRQFDHPSLVVAIDRGRLVRMLAGASVPSASLREVVQELRGKFVASYTLAGKVAFRCFEYDPTSGRYSLDWGLALMLLPGTCALLATAWVFFFRPSRHRKESLPREHPAA